MMIMVIINTKSLILQTTAKWWWLSCLRVLMFCMPFCAVPQTSHQCLNIANTTQYQWNSYFICYQKVAFWPPKCSTNRYCVRAIASCRHSKIVSIFVVFYFAVIATMISPYQATVSSQRRYSSESKKRWKLRVILCSVIHSMFSRHRY